ncbi:hypothetical protein LH612_30025 [Klebsiella pneumoniae]|nr:hypothetical protein [Klebsiella pneumoniae]
MPEISTARIREELALSEELVQRSLEKAEQAKSERIEVDLDSDLGQAVFSAYGELLELNRNVEQMRFTNGRTLGAVIVKAVNSGEEQARRFREQH